MILFFIFIGLWLGLNIRFNWITLLIGSIILIVFIFFRYKKKICLLFVLSCLIGVGTSFINIEQDKTQYKGVVIEAKENYYLFSNGLEKLYIKHISNPYEVGDMIYLEGEKCDLDFKLLESGFDFEDYLTKKGVSSAFKVTYIDVLFKNPIRFNAYKKKFIFNFAGDTQGFIGSIYFGSGFQSGLSNTLRDLHLFRLSTLSGLSIYAILKVLTYLLGLKLDEKKAEKIAYIILIPYFIFSIGKFAVFKIVSMFILKLINDRFLQNKFCHMDLLSILGIGCLIFDYHLAYQDGFKLSFLMSIILHFFNNSFTFLTQKKKKVFMSIFIVAFFLPFELIFHHEFSIFGPIFQIALSPLIIIISISTMLCFYGIPIYHFVDTMVRALSTIVNFIKPGFITIYAGPFPLWFSLIYEAILLFTTYLFSIRFKPLYKLPLIFASVLSLYFVPISPYFKTYITFLNIGQGDSTFIHVQGLDILVDTGGNLNIDIAKTCLIPFFKKNKIYSLDYLITTHDDFDHVGAKESLMENFRVKNYLREIDQFPLICGDFVMNNLNIYSTDSEEENENSLVLQFSLKDTDILIMGDAPKNIETAIIKDHPDLRCDILKVGHHGSNTSSGYTFVKTVDPDVAIISCGKHNKYGHPHDEVLNVLNKLNVEIRRTDIESSITYYF